MTQIFGQVGTGIALYRLWPASALSSCDASIPLNRAQRREKAARDRKRAARKAQGTSKG
jgi:hypothetical protein